MVAYPKLSAVAESFSKAAKSYDAAAILQNDVADNLLGRAEPYGRVLDLGCGTGRNTQLIIDKAAVTECVGLDIAQGMLDFAKQRVATTKLISWIKADAKTLPFADHHFDFIYSSLMVQWLGADIDFFKELHRVLKPGGTAMMSTLLPGTLTELQQAWLEVDDSIHINEFESESAWLSAISAAGLQLECEQQSYCRYFDSAIASMRELKDLGARNLNQGRSLGLTGKNRIKQFGRAYERFRQADGLPATYKLLMLRITKPL